MHIFNKYRTRYILCAQVLYIMWGYGISESLKDNSDGYEIFLIW